MPDPGAPATSEDLWAQFELLVRIRDAQQDVNDAIDRVHTIHEQASAWAGRTEAGPAVVGAAESASQSLDALRDQLTRRYKKGGDDMIVAQAIDTKLAAIRAVVAYGSAAPTKQFYEVFEEIEAEVRAALADLVAVLAGDVTALNAAIRDNGPPAISVGAKASNRRTGD